MSRATAVVSMSSGEVAPRSSRGRGWTGFALALLSFLAFPWPGEASAVARVATIGEAVERWQPEIHLYVLGDVGLEEAVLADLAGELDGTHWTVLLVGDATGQTFRDVEGTVRQGDEAIEYGAGQGFPRRHGFAAQVHPRTGEPDGAVFALVLAQRALFYVGSKAQDSRGLGEAAFAGRLDAWAIEAMRNGGDVAGAVRATVSGIDRALADAVENESAGAASTLQQAQMQVDSLERTAAEVLRAHPGAALARRDTRALRAGIEAARAELEHRPAEAQRLAKEALRRAVYEEKLLLQYQADAGVLPVLEEALAPLERHERAAVAAGEIQEARRVLAELREIYRRGDPAYAERLWAARQAVDLAAATIAAEDARARALKGWLVVLATLFFAVAISGGVALRWRRKPVRQEAEDLLTAWQAALDRKLEALFGELERRVASAIGPVTGDGGHGFAGETARLAEQVRADVGSLSILWTSAAHVLEQAREQIRPRRAAAVLFNLFFVGRYRRGIALLRDEPVPFDPAEGLPRLFGGERHWRDDLLGDLALYEPFRKSFQELIDEFHTRAERATAALDRLESRREELPGLLQSAGERLVLAEAQRRPLEEAAAGDGLFRVPALFATVLPAASRALAAATAAAPSDPVGAAEGDGARAARLAEEACQLTTVLRSARSGVLPSVTESDAALRRAEVAVAWVGETLREAARRAERLAGGMLEESIATEIEDLAVDLAALGERAARAVELSSGAARAALRERQELLARHFRESEAALDADPLVTRATLQELAGVGERLRPARAALDATPPDPVSADEALRDAQALLDRVNGPLVAADRALHAESGRGAAEAERWIAAAEELARRTAADGVADSAAITGAREKLALLPAAAARVRRDLAVPHGDWHAAIAEAGRIAAEAEQLGATLERELAAAQAILASLATAALHLREARLWRGAHGEQVDGMPGEQDLEMARSLLAQGLYGEAERTVLAARQAASEALDRAREAERREAERRREEADARSASAARASRSSSSLSGSSGAGRSSGGGSSSGAGSSRSSSGSGAGRSRW